MISLQDVLLGARLLVTLAPFLREPIGLAEARAVLRRRLEQRERDFLALVRDAVYASPASPYRTLLALAGCEQGDLGCLEPAHADDVHLFHDCHALIQPGDGGVRPELPAGALLVSTLRRTAPLILLNVSMGDEAVVEERRCGCALEGLGWRVHLRTIRSYEKLTAGGMTFLDGDIIPVLEEWLPARFGGGPTDYQLVEDTRPRATPGSGSSSIRPSVLWIRP